MHQFLLHQIVLLINAILCLIIKDRDLRFREIDIKMFYF